ncbi:MAG: protein kinase [Gemmataceae bacterium]
MPSDAPRVEKRSGHDEPLPTHPDSARMLAELPSASAADGASLEGTMVQHERTDSARNTSALPVIPGYQVISELARGGMGIVFNAHDLSLDREVAIKTLLPELSTRRDLAAQFDREARITARLQHPGVPPIHALGTLSDGRPFLVMKLIRGRTLQDEIDLVERPGGLPRLLGVFEQLCQTVGYAHSLGIIHRDLKPLNVMVGAFGEVQVMDWGLAREVQGRTLSTFSDEDSHPSVVRDDASKSGPQAGTTRVGRAKGTSSYMPPEQARGVWSHVDTRADVFALGGILCTILTGKPPYVGATGQAILSMAMEGDLQEAFDRLDACGADAELISLSKRCMSVEFTDRPGTGKVVAEAIAAYRAGVELRARKAETEWAVSEARDEEAAHGHALAYCTLGNALQDKGDLVAAIEAYHEAIQLNPHFARRSRTSAWRCTTPATCPELSPHTANPSAWIPRTRRPTRTSASHCGKPETCPGPSPPSRK